MQFETCLSTLLDNENIYGTSVSHFVVHCCVVQINYSNYEIEYSAIHHDQQLSINNRTCEFANVVSRLDDLEQNEHCIFTTCKDVTYVFYYTKLSTDFISRA